MNWYTTRAWKRCTACRQRFLASAQRSRCIECAYRAERARDRENKKARHDGARAS